jgi:citrate synthase
MMYLAKEHEMSDVQSSSSKDYLSAKEAMQLLEIRQQTLYAYVSRGWVRSITQVGRKSHLYLREDVEKMRARSQARSGHGVVAASAMNWGEPIIPTSITEITPEGPRYRGRLAVQLARSRTSYETVAELLWTGLWHEDPIRWPARNTGPILRKIRNTIVAPETNDQLLETFALFALQLGIPHGSVAERVRSGRTLEAAREIIRALTGCFGYISNSRRFYNMASGQPIVDGLIKALVLPETDENRETLEAMLILFADHELSPGAFAARVAASSGASLNNCIASAICVSSGVQIGRLYDRVEEFIANTSSKSVLLRRAQQLQERGSAVPGFVHPLYPHGDPRGRYLIELVKQRKNQSKRLEAIYGFVEDAESKLGIFPRHELAVMTLAIAVGLPEHCAGALFSLARTAGYVAHVQEQRMSGLLLRPRAKFVGQSGIVS